MNAMATHDSKTLGVTATRDGYSGLQIALHWIIAALVVTQLLNNGGMQEAWNAYEDGAAAPEGTLGFAWFHALTGATILVLALIRLYVRLTCGAGTGSREAAETIATARPAPFAPTAV